DEVDALRRDPERGEVVEIRAVALVPRRVALARLVVADAGVDENRAARRADHVGLDARAEIADGLVEEVRLEPVVVSGDRLRRGLRQHHRGRARRAAYHHHAVDRDVAEPDWG